VEKVQLTFELCIKANEGTVATNHYNEVWIGGEMIQYCGDHWRSDP